MWMVETLENWPALPLAADGKWSVEWTVLAVLAGMFCAVALKRLVDWIFTARAAAYTPLLSRLMSRWVRSFDYSGDQFLSADGAGEHWIDIRKLAIERLSQHFRQRSGNSIDWGNRIRTSFSDLRFTDANRVPFPFASLMREKFNLCSVVTASSGPRLQDLDGNWTLDVSGSYGLNVAGFDRYKEWIDRGWERVRDLGPVLGPLHPVVAENIELLKSISKLDEVSFHMSGTEAVMAAVRLARFNTRRKFIVCFSGAYHGWWDGVQPGLGSERPAADCLTLKDFDPASLAAIRRRANEIAAVLINPVQSFHPNLPPPSDAVLLTSAVRKVQDSTSEYAQWLCKLREVCAQCGIALIFDEVFSGFRLAPAGAQEFFGVQADMVVYGKTVAGGMPIGVVCGKKELMRRFDPVHPMRIAYVIGTFSAHPLVMGAMNEFLHWLVRPETARIYDEARGRCERWVQSINRRLEAASLPLRVMNLATVWTVMFKEPGRYDWLLQYYMRAEGLTLSWVGTGRCMNSLDFTDSDYDDLQARIFDAAQKMKSDGWWLSEAQQPDRKRKMRAFLVREAAAAFFQIPQPAKEMYAEIMQRKRDDHVASHSNLINQLLHLLSSSTFVICYLLIFVNFELAVSLGVVSLLLRQFGHAILEPPCHDKEKLLLGYNTRNKSLILGAYVLIPAVHLAIARSASIDAIRSVLPAAARDWFILTIGVVMGRVIYLAHTHDIRSAIIWLVKLITDPITDILAYYSSVSRILSLPQHKRREAA